MSKKKIVIIVITCVLLFTAIIGCVAFFIVSFCGKSAQNDDKYNLFKNGYLAVKKDDNWGVIDKNGNTVIPFKYEDLKVCDSGDLFLVKEDGKYGFINKESIYEINNDYDAADVFGENGLAPVEKNGKWGYINKNGKYIINPQYELAFVFQNDTAVVMKNNNNYLIDKEGKILTKKGYLSIENFADNNYFAVSEDKGDAYKEGLIDRKGKEIIVPQFESLDMNNNDTAIVKKDKKYGVIDFDGKYILKPEFDSVYYHSLHKIYVTKSGDIYNLFDANGKKTVDEDFENDLIFGKNGLAPVKKEGKWGYINTKGKTVIKPEFESAKIFGKYDLAPVKIKGKWRYIDTDGKQIKKRLSAKNDDIEPFSECGFACFKMNKRWGLIDKNLKVIIDPEWRKFADYYSDVILLANDEKDIFIINNEGDVVGNAGYEAFGNNGECYCKQDGCYEHCFGGYCYDHMDINFDIDDESIDY